MSRVLGCVASEPVTLHHELVEAPNPLVRGAEPQDSSWGMSVYRRGEGEEPTCAHFPDAAFTDEEFERCTKERGRIFNAHVRRATMGGLSDANTHPFCLGSYSFSHNGTILDFPRLAESGLAAPHGSTDSEVFFNLLTRDFDPERAVESLRRSVQVVIDRCRFTSLNFLFCDGEKLYAYRLGVCELHWCARDGRLLVASDRLGEDDGWHDVRQDVLLVCDPRDPVEPHAERLVGDVAVARARIDTFDEGDGLPGRERGVSAEQRAARLAGPTPA